MPTAVDLSVHAQVDHIFLNKGFRCWRFDCIKISGKELSLGEKWELPYLHKEREELYPEVAKSIHRIMYFETREFYLNITFATLYY